MKLVLLEEEWVEARVSSVMRALLRPERHVSDGSGVGSFLGAPLLEFLVQVLLDVVGLSESIRNRRHNTQCGVLGVFDDVDDVLDVLNDVVGFDGGRVVSEVVGADGQNVARRNSLVLDDHFAELAGPLLGDLEADLNQFSGSGPWRNLTASSSLLVK